jgi:protein TonB
MTTLLESGARPYGSSKGIVVSMLLHGTLIAAAIIATAQVALPPREKIEEHPILYVAPPPPKEIHVAPDPLPAVKTPPKAKPAPAVKRAEPPRPRQAQPRPAVQPKAPSIPALVAPSTVPVNVPAIDLTAPPTVGDIVAPPPPEPITRSGSGAGERSGASGDAAGGSRSGLGSGDAARTYSENQVEKIVEVTRQASPRYPDALRSVGVEGVVQVTFVVGTNGRVEPGSIKVSSTPHRLFSEAVRSALLDMRFRPAEVGGRPVRQLVAQSFKFKLEK